MKKVLSIVAIVILVLIVVLVFFLGSIVKAGIETVGPKVAGVAVTVEKVRVNPLTGMVHVNALLIGNPEGFQTPSAMELGEFKLDISLASLMSDTVVIKQILIDAPEITYEKNLRSSNLAELQKNLTPDEAEWTEEEPAEKPDKEKGSAKKVVIEDFQLNNAKVNVSITALGGRKMILPLPAVHLQDIGKDSGGASPAEVVAEVFGSVREAVVQVVAAGADMAGDALKGAGGMAGDTVKDVSGSATDAAKGATDAIKKGVGGLFGKE
jgi:hypothetical protein